MKKIFFSFIFCCLFVIGAEVPEYSCYQITEVPIIDGKIEESIWSTIPTATGFYILGREEYALEKQTYFKAGWNKKYLYIAITAEEPAVEKITAKLSDKNSSLWMEDSIELFIFPKKGDNYLQFVVNAIGSRWIAIELGGSTQSLWNWQAKTYFGENYWSLEIEIPFDILGKIPENGEKWSVNIARNILTGPSKERYTCWPPLQNGFNDISNFGFFIFKEGQISLDESKNLERKINISYYNSLKEKIYKIASCFSEYKDIINKAIGTSKFKKEGLDLKEIWMLVEDISKKGEASIEEYRFVLSRSNNLIERSENLKTQILLESLFKEE